MSGQIRSLAALAVRKLVQHAHSIWHAPFHHRLIRHDQSGTDAGAAIDQSRIIRILLHDRQNRKTNDLARIDRTLLHGIFHIKDAVSASKHRCIFVFFNRISHCSKVSSCLFPIRLRLLRIAAVRLFSLCFLQLRKHFVEILCHLMLRLRADHFDRVSTL